MIWDSTQQVAFFIAIGHGQFLNRTLRLTIIFLYILTFIGCRGRSSTVRFSLQKVARAKCSKETHPQKR